MGKSREVWVDNVKVFACILVALGHFLQSMTKAGILPSADWTYWIDNTVYFFHVPLFFLCSGFLYQRYSRIDSFSDWKNHVIKKAITLGVPYMVFSIATWLLKTVFSGSVNTGNEGLLETLFITPTAPYWFLYDLFFMFLLIPLIRGPKMLIAVTVVAMAGKLVFSWSSEWPDCLAFRLLGNGVWFVTGMVLAHTDVLKKCSGRKWLLAGCLTAAAFLTLSVFFHHLRRTQRFVAFGMGILGCVATVLIINCAFAGRKQSRVWAFMARYTMPVFLMHTIFAAGWRAVLLKLGVSNAMVHIVSGLAISFIAPIIAAEIMGKIKCLDFLINPGKYVRIGKKKPVQQFDKEVTQDTALTE